MKNLEKIYVGISILMALAILSLLIPKPYIYGLWNSRGHGLPLIGLIFSGLSLILGVFGFILLAKEQNKKKNNNMLVVATFLATGLYVCLVYFFKLNILEFLFLF